MLFIIKNMDYEKQYRNILNNITTYGKYKKDRTGVGCHSLFNQSINISVEKYFPILTGRKMFCKIFNTEFKWFISGETNIEMFKENNIKIWNEWANENGDLGPVYGFQLRNYNGKGLDQLKAIINSLKQEPESRRHIITLWNPLQTHLMALPPCYLYFQFFVDGNKLNMFVVQRSGDMFLGVPYDMALFTTVLNYICYKTNYTPGKLNVNIIDAHIYVNHKNAVDMYRLEKTFILPEYKFNIEEGVELTNYQCGKNITAPVAV
jgi:thymidylate synthase